MSKRSAWERHLRREKIGVVSLWLVFGAGLVFGVVQLFRSDEKWSWWALLAPPVIGLIAVVVVIYVGGALSYVWIFLGRVWKWLVDREIERRERKLKEGNT